jgi:4-hydroxy-tetrahydrodipicolinate synthase
MRRTRACCGPTLDILSGDDALTLEMMTDPLIQAAGVISVVTNVAPGAVSQMVRHLLNKETDAAGRLHAALTPLFDLVTVKTTEKTPYGDVVCRARNPLGIKTLMAILGMPSGGCRQPLGKMTQNGLEKVLAAARRVREKNPEILKPVSETFGVNIDERLNTSRYWEGLIYDGY